MSNMKILDQHNADLKSKKYTGVVTDFSGYIQFGEIKGRPNHDTIGYTADQFKNFIECITNPSYAYARQKNGYINIYGNDGNSPTGISLIGGIPNELEYLLKVFGKTGQLSPTEDMRTAH